MKGAIPFRGAPMAAIRRVVNEVWEERGIDELSLEEQIEIALGQFQHRHSEDKVAGVLMFAEHLLGSLETKHVTYLARPFEEGHIQDWSTCDWYCVKALGPFIALDDRKRRALRVAGWRNNTSLWQRRAAAVAFVEHAPQGDRFFDGFTDLVLTVCQRNVHDPARFSQKSVGWVLLELSKAEPDSVAGFVQEHEAQMSREALRAATKHL